MKQVSKRAVRSRWFSLTLGLAVSLACLWWAFQQMLKGPDGPKPPQQVLHEIGSAFQQANYVTLPLMWLCLAAFYWLKALRWKYLLQPLGNFHPTRDLMPSTVIGFAFNNVLPAHLGEFVRVFVFARQTGLKRTAVLSSIVLERIFDVVAILSFLLLGLSFAGIDGLDPTVRVSAWIFSGAAVTGLLCAAVFLVWTRPVVRLVDRILAAVPFIPEAVGGKVAGIVHDGADGLSSLRSGRLLFGILVTSWLQWLLNATLIYFSLRAFDLPSSLAVSAIVMGVTAFGVTVPSSPGYFGVIQVCFLLVMKLFVDEHETVFAASIYYHMVQWIPVTAIGMVFFLKTGLSVAEVEAAPDDPAASSPDTDAF